MFEEIYAPLPDAAAYLRRIGIPAAEAPDIAFLDRIVFAHQCHIPFENLDVFDRDTVPSLAVAELFDKLVTRRRGGYCFEMNGLLASALAALGFECHSVSVRISKPGVRLPLPGHRSVVVRLSGGRYYCDVGYGGPSPHRALKLDSDEPQVSGEYTFRFFKEGAQIRLRCYKDGAEVYWMLFADAETDPVDFLPQNEFQAHSPASYFRSRRIVNLTLPDGSLSLTNNRLVIRRAGETRTLVFDGERELRAALSEYFGIVADFPLREVSADMI